MRVYEIAKEVGIPNKDLIAKIRALGLEVNNHMSSLDADDVARIKRSLEKEKQSVAQPQQTQRLAPGGTVLRRRSSGDRASEPSADDRSAEREPIRARTEPERHPGAPSASAPAAGHAAPAPVIRRRVVAEDTPTAPPSQPSSAPRPVVRAPEPPVMPSAAAVESRAAEPRPADRLERATWSAWRATGAHANARSVRIAWSASG